MVDNDLLDLDRFQRLEHHEMFRELRQQAPVVWHDGGDRLNRGFWSVVRHAQVQEASRDPERFSNELGGVNLRDVEELGSDSRGVLLTEMDPPKHTRYRLLVNKGFTPRMVKLLEDVFVHRARLIVDNVIERGEADLVEDISAELPLQAIAEIMGVPQEDRKLVFEWSNRMIGGDDPDFGGENDGSAAAAELYAYVNRLAAERRSDPRDDIVTKLLGAEIDGDKLTEHEFDSFMLLLSVAGNETTRNTTSWGMAALMAHPEQYTALRDDLDGRLDLAIEEMLRWASPVYHFRRTAVHDTQLGGVDIPAGDKVVLWYISANRDEDVFDDPFTFDMARTPNEHVAFGGGGLHFCLGANLARLELRTIFREILERIPDMRPTAEPKILRSNFIGGIKHLPISFTPSTRRRPVGA